jgi:hypothetical protein
MNLKRHQIETIIKDWMEKFNNFDLPGVMEYFHDDIIFENWDDASIKGKKLLSRAWKTWFKNKNFNFEIGNIHVDSDKQTAILEWHLQWFFNNNNESRRGIDILFFHDTKIITKKTYTKTLINIESAPVMLSKNR